MVGAGNIARFHLVSALEANFEIVAIGSRPGSSKALVLAKEFDIPIVFNQINELKKLEFDAFSVTVSTKAQLEVLKKINCFDLPTLVEKPVSLNYHSIKKFIRNFNSQKIIVAFNRRHYPSVLALKRIIEISKGGVSFHINIPELSWVNYQSKSSSHNFFKENSVHILDLTQYLYGKVKIINKISKFQNGLYAVKAILETEKHSIGTLSISFFTQANLSISVDVDQFCYDLKPLEELWKIEKLNVGYVSKNGHFKRYNPESVRIKSGGSFASASKLGFFNLYRDLFRMCETGYVGVSADINDAYHACKLATDLIS